MAHLNIDFALIQEAVALTDGETVDHVIEAALREYIQRRRQLRVINLFGTIDYENYDYKQQRLRLP